MMQKLVQGVAASAAVLLAGCSSPPCRSFREAHIQATDVGPRCRPGREYLGTPHAMVSAQSTWLDPQRTAQQYFDCDGLPAVLYTFDFGSETEAKSKAALLRTSLWTGAGPDATHPDELLVKGQVVVIVSSPDPSHLSTVLADRGFEPFRS
jgi:hypothetical protein